MIVDPSAIVAVLKGESEADEMPEVLSSAPTLAMSAASYVECDARAAYRDVGWGSGHPAGLNFGDVFAYALAIETGEPLLFEGDHFCHTDVHAVHEQ